jgi:WD40 repeat protein
MATIRSVVALVVFAGLNSPSVDQRPSVRFDGLEMFFFSSRTGTLGFADLSVTVRSTVVDSWSPPVNLGPPINSTVNDLQPYIAADRRTLYFASNRAGSLGGLDLYVTTRVRQQP